VGELELASAQFDGCALHQRSYAANTSSSILRRSLVDVETIFIQRPSDLRCTWESHPEDVGVGVFDDLEIGDYDLVDLVAVRSVISAVAVAKTEDLCWPWVGPM